MSSPKKTYADAKALRKWNMELGSEVKEKRVLATVESALLKALTVKLVSVKSNSNAGRVERANFGWGTYSAVKSASKAIENVSTALRVMAGEVTYATKQKAAFFALDPKNTMKQLLTQIIIESRAAIMSIRAELKGDDSEALQNFATC